jgi:tetratricopeptide (TPR) repeat protein
MIPVIRVFGAAVTLTVLSLVSGAARAAGESNTDKARAHFQQGDTYFKLDRYATALQEFEQAYLAKQDPSFLYNIAQCHRLLGHRVEAIRFYKRYVTDAPTAPNRPVAEKHIRDLETALSAEEMTGAHTAPPPVPPASSESHPSPASPPQPPPTAPPPNLALNAPPQARQSDAVLTNPTGAPTQTDEHPFYTRWWFWTAVGGAVATGVVLALLLGRDPSCPSGRQCQ